MSWLTTMLRPIAWAAGTHARRQAGRFLRALERPAETQTALLRRLLTRLGASEFARDHGLDRVGSYEEFTRALPVCDYQTYRPYIDRVLAGQPTALLGESMDVLMFSMTSGTTGQAKFIPVTRQFLSDVRRGWNIFGIRVLGDHPDGWLRRILQISSAMREQDSPTGVPCGAISGLLARTQKRIVRRMYVAPWLAAGADPVDKYYTVLRWAVDQDVGLITTANPSSTIKLIQTGQDHVQRLLGDIRDGTCRPPGRSVPLVGKDRRFRANPKLARQIEAGIARDGRLLPGHFWSVSFLTNWTGGTVGLYLPRLGELFPGVPVRDIGLLASEGRFTIPLVDETPAGPAEILGNFLEFIPAEDRRKDNPSTLRVHELTEGREYFLVFSNWTGLLRYNLDDRVRVVGFQGRTPILEFLCRGLRTSSITGEKITEHQVVAAFAAVTGSDPAGEHRFRLQGCFCDQPYYELTVETGQGVDAAGLADAFDRRLGEINIEYASKRHSGRLGPVRARTVEAGFFDRAEAEEIARRRGRGEQYKHQYLLTDVAEATGRAAT